MHKITVASSIVWLFLLLSCSSESSKQSGDGALIVTVDGKSLTREEVELTIPQGLSPADSTLAAEAYIKLWIKDQLVYDKAKENITDEAMINELVENYRHSLVVFTYQEQLLKEQLAKKISEKDLKAYYDEHPDQFRLENNIIKGLFLKVPRTSPQVENFKKWYRSKSSVEKIEKVSLQNATVYDYFYDKWVSFEDVMNNIPITFTNNGEFLKKNKFIEHQDSTYVYLLNIVDYRLNEEPAPYEYAQPKVLDIVLNQKKATFLSEFENDLYERALKNKSIEFHNKNK